MADRPDGPGRFRVTGCGPSFAARWEHRRNLIAVLPVTMRDSSDSGHAPPGVTLRCMTPAASIQRHAQRGWGGAPMGLAAGINPGAGPLTWQMRPPRPPNYVRLIDVALVAPLIASTWSRSLSPPAAAGRRQRPSLVAATAAALVVVSSLALAWAVDSLIDHRTGIDNSRWTFGSTASTWPGHGRTSVGRRQAGPGRGRHLCCASPEHACATGVELTWPR